MDIYAYIRSLLFTPFKSADELWRKRAKWAEINEFFGWQVISSDNDGYNPPFLSNPFNSSRQQISWTKQQHDSYDYPTPEHAAEANRIFEFVYNMIKDRVEKDAVVFDVGCNAGFQMDNLYKKGFKNVWGIDPMTYAIDRGREKRPHLNFIEGFFGDPKNDVQCDLLTFFGSIFRIPYSTRVFDAIDRCASKYVTIYVQEAVDDFSRDPHIGLAKKGFICIEKHVVEHQTYISIGLKGADGPMLVPGNREKKNRPQRNYLSFFLFRRIEPREPAPKKQRHQLHE